MAKLEVPEFTVYTESKPEGVTVRVTSGVLVRWDMEAKKKGWEFESQGQLWAAWCAFTAGQRSGQWPTDMPFEVFLDELVLVKFGDGSDETDLGKATSSELEAGS